MKQCSKCGVLKSLDKFNKRSRSKDGFQQHCKECHKQLNIAHYATNKSLYISRARASIKDLKPLVEDKKKQGCVDCGEKRHWVLDFHHTNPKEKDMNVSALLRRGSKDRIVQEIDKCVVLCRNCHADRHHNMKHVGKVLR